MESVAAGNGNVTSEFDDTEDALSLCDLSPDEGDSKFPPQNPKPASDPEEFDFQIFSNPIFRPAAIIFCGKTISYDVQSDSNNKHKYSISSIRPDSFTSSQKSHFYRSNSHSSRNRTSASSAKNINHLLIGVAKFRPDMELSELKKRQSRRNPVPLFIVDDGKTPGESHWGLLKLLRTCRLQ